MNAYTETGHQSMLVWEEELQHLTELLSGQVWLQMEEHVDYTIAQHSNLIADQVATDFQVLGWFENNTGIS